MYSTCIYNINLIDYLKMGADPFKSRVRGLMAMVPIGIRNFLSSKWYIFMIKPPGWGERRYRTPLHSMTGTDVFFAEGGGAATLANATDA